jgi:hypothetical protein
MAYQKDLAKRSAAVATNCAKSENVIALMTKILVGAGSGSGSSNSNSSTCAEQIHSGGPAATPTPTDGGKQDGICETATA